MFTDLTWFASVIALINDILGVCMTAPLSYFLIIGIVSTLAIMVRKFVRLKSR